MPRFKSSKFKPGGGIKPLKERLTQSALAFRKATISRKRKAARVPPSVPKGGWFNRLSNRV